MRRPALALALLVASCASTAPRTQVIVRIEADPGIDGDARHLRVIVRAGPNRSTDMLAVRSERDYPDVGAPVFPVEIGLVPADGDSGRVFEVTALAQDDGSPRHALATARVISGYVAGQTLLVTLRLEDACRGVMCGTTQTCRSGDCFDAFVEPTLLAPYGIDAGRRPTDVGMDSASARDAGDDREDSSGEDAREASDAHAFIDAPEMLDGRGVDVGFDDATIRDAGLPDASGSGPCVPRSVSGDRSWPNYPLPGSPGHPRRYWVSEETVVDCVTGLEWERYPADASYTFAAANEQCESLGLGGGGWRLPSTIELLTLVDYSIREPGPKIDGSAFPSTRRERFWAASPLADSTMSAWHVNFSVGTAFYGGVTAAWRTRCVR